MKLNKKGKLGTNTLNTVVLAIVILVVLFASYAAIIPEAQTAGNSLNESNQCTRAGCFFNASGDTTGVNCYTANGSTSDTACSVDGFENIPLSGLFSGTGVVFVIVMAALLILVVKGFMSSNK